MNLMMMVHQVLGEVVCFQKQIFSSKVLFFFKTFFFQNILSHTNQKISPTRL